VPKGKPSVDPKVIAIALVAVAVVVAAGLSGTPRELVSGYNDEEHPVLFDLCGGGGEVTSESVKGLKVEIGEEIGCGLYGNYLCEGRGFQPRGEGLIDVYVTNENGWDDLWGGLEPEVKLGLEESKSSGDFSAVIPQPGAWYVIFDRSEYTDYYDKTVEGTVYRDLTPPDIDVEIETCPWSGLVPINFTITDLSFSISRVEITLGGVPIGPSYENLDRGKSFSDVIAFNTTQREDGYRLLQIIAWDRAGNYRTWAQPVEIRNTPNYALWIMIGIGILGIMFILWQSFEGAFATGSAVFGVLVMIVLEAVLYIVAVMGYGFENALALLTGGFAIAALAYGSAHLVDKK
jgi:hypothetical protein